MDATALQLARAARGFMPDDEGLALYEAARTVPVEGPMVEIGSYCGKSALYLGVAARERKTVLFAIDHHRGSEENQIGWAFHEPDLVDQALGKIDTFPMFRRTVHDADLEGTVIAIVGDSPTVARHFGVRPALVFIDGGHGAEPAHRDYESWAPLVATRGYLAIHDVFPDPADGGRPPYEIYRRALESGAYREVSATGSLRVLQHA